MKSKFKTPTMLDQDLLRRVRYRGIGIGLFCLFGGTGRLVSQDVQPLVVEMIAFAEFVLRWHGRLRTHAERLTGHSAAADDVLQETWIAVLKGLGRLSDVVAFRAWLFRILSRKAADWIRRRQRQRRLHERFAEETLAGNQRKNRLCRSSRESSGPRGPSSVRATSG